MSRLLMVLFSMLVVACGGGGGYVDFSGPVPFDPLPDAAVGGAWIGTDSFDNEIIALSTDSGRLHWLVPTTGEQGFGTVSVQSRTTTIEFTYVAPLGSMLDDGIGFRPTDRRRRRANVFDALRLATVVTKP